MKRILIPYLDNKEKPIIKALAVLTEYCHLSIEEAGKLRETFRDQKDISYAIENNIINKVLYHLKSEGFLIKLDE